VPEDLRPAIETRLMDRLALDDARLVQLAGPTTLSEGEVAALRRSSALRRSLRRVPLLRDAARAVYRALRGSDGGPR
jgi:hypothetical protein